MAFSRSHMFNEPPRPMESWKNEGASDEYISSWMDMNVYEVKIQKHFKHHRLPYWESSKWQFCIFSILPTSFLLGRFSVSFQKILP